MVRLRCHAKKRHLILLFIAGFQVELGGGFLSEGQRFLVEFLDGLCGLYYLD